MKKPLALQLRPQKLDEVVGQEHLVGKDGVVRKMIKKKQLFSLIFYGPSGTGKTTLANVIVNELNVRYRELNAVINNKKDFDVVFEEAKMHDGLVLILDEIHRLNKDKQDILLPHIESGLITLIGLTSANPFHKINPAIRSRCHLFALKPLNQPELKTGLELVINNHFLDLEITEKAKEAIVQSANYDMRNILNNLEMALLINPKKITLTTVKKLQTAPIHLSDANEDNHYDMLSAFQKSIRGGDVHASLYYLGRLIVVEDLDSIYRRLTVISYEDIGLANPNLHMRINLGIMACERVGLPEARIILSNLVIEAALAPKSNSAYLAIDEVLNDIAMGASHAIPKHLKNNHPNYKYPHNYQHSYVKQQYLPDEIKKAYYYPKDNKVEKQYQTILDNIKKNN